MKTNGIITLVYGVVVLAGGLFGFFKAHSFPSLISGIVFGSLLITSAFDLSKEKSWGFPVALGSTTFLALFFIYRFYSTGMFMPAGLMLILSLIVLGLLSWNKRPLA